MGAVINRDVILKVAKLSALELSEQDILTLQERLSQIVNYVNQLEKLNVDGVPELNVIDRDEMFRTDEVKQDISAEEVLFNATEKGRGCFKLPKVI